MKFTFDQKLKFHCRRCGGCCKQSSIDLSDNEIPVLEKYVNNDHYKKVKFEGERFEHAPWNIKYDTEACPLLVDNSCSIYDSRFGICRIYPFDFVLLPSEEIQIELIHCPGVGYHEGIPLNEVNIKNWISELRNYDENYFIQLLNSRKCINDWLSGYYLSDVMSLDKKIELRNKLTMWFKDNKLKNYPIEVKYHSLYMFMTDVYERVFSTFIRDMNYDGLKPPIILTDLGVDGIFRNLNDVFHQKKIFYMNKGLELKQKSFNNIDEIKTFTSYEDFKKIDKNIDDKMVYETRNQEKIHFTFKDTMVNKSWSKEALRTANRYIIEVSKKMGRSGIMIGLSIMEYLNVLSYLSSALWSASKIYSISSNIITEESVIEAITYLDERTVSMQMNNRVLSEHRSHLINK